MANYSLIVNSKFQPFSFERYIQPYQMYGAAYKELENQYGELATKASVWEEMANEQTDPYAYKMYKTYANDLEEQAGQLAREGLNATSRRDMLNMRTRYSKEITPIEQAYTARQKQAEQQQQALLQDPTLMLSRRAATTSLDDYIRNPQLSYESYSGKLITAQVASAASALAKEMQEKPRKWRSILGNSYYETIMQKGISSDIISKFLYYADEIIYNGVNPETVGIPSELASKLQEVLESPLASSGMRDWKNNMSKSDWKSLTARVNNYAREGLWRAVGETQYQTLDNWRAKMAEQEAMQKRAEQRVAERQKQAQLNNLAINPLNIYSSRELSKDEKKYNDNIKKYSKYFYKENGQWKMNQAGWKAYNEKEDKWVSANGWSSYRVKDADSDFKTFIDSLGGKGAISSNNFGPNQRINVGRLWGRYVDNSSAARIARYDATRVTEYDYPIAGTQQGDMKDAIMTAGRGLSLKQVDYDSKSKKFKDTGEEITMEDLKSDKYKVTATRFSPYGTTVMIQDDKGDVRRYRMPAGINTTNEQNRDRAMAAANQWQQVVSTGQYTDARGNVHQATPDEITYAQQQYAQAIQQAYLFHSQLGVQNKTKEQEFNPYGY